MQRLVYIQHPIYIAFTCWFIYAHRSESSDSDSDEFSTTPATALQELELKIAALRAMEVELAANAEFSVYFLSPFQFGIVQIFDR